MRLDTASLNQHYADYYNGASEWRELGATEKAHSVLTLLDGQHRASVLDVGCGDGSVIALLDGALPNAHLVGIEVSASALEAARGRSYTGDVTFALFDGETIGSADGTYDLAILSHVVEHVADPRGLLNEAARVARQVVVEVPLELHLRMPRYQWDATGHINVYNRRSIRHLVESCGLSVRRELVYSPGREIQTFHHRPGSTLKWAIKSAALHVGGQALFTYHFAMLADPSH